MISLDLIRACVNPGCTLVLPADPDAWRQAGFSVVNRIDGRPVFEDLCKDCSRRQRRRQRRHPGSSNNLVYETFRNGERVRVKVCRRCSVEKVCHSEDRSEFSIHKRRKGVAIVWNPICKTCKNEKHAERMETDPEYAERWRRVTREGRLRWLASEENRQKALRASRDYHRRLRREDVGLVRELERMDYVLRRERQGKTVKHRETVIDHVHPRIPLGPFLDWLLAYELEFGLDNAEQLGQDLAISPRRIFSILNGQYSRVELDIVSRALTNSPYSIEVNGRLIVTIDDLYGEEPLRG